MSNKCLLSIISNITNNKNELWKTVGWTSFQKPHCNPFQSPSSLSMRVSFCLSMLSIPCFRVLCGYFYVSLNLVAAQSGGGSHCLDFDKFCDTAPLKFDSLRVWELRYDELPAEVIYHIFYRGRVTSNKEEKRKGKRPRTLDRRSGSGRN